MLLTISTTHRPATDLGFLRHKNPDRLHGKALTFGRALMAYPEASDERCTFALAVEFARYGITANAILPGWIATDMTADAMANAKFAEAAGKRIPVRRWGEKEDFGGIAAYLMSDASAYHTGQLIQIDGGYWRF